ncbi:nuclear transport factor 2 family protein [Microtetraspora sp. AC03309]|uniref:nuclear transport factor 2 family protein n=1 Tax=Microtetraspora sp. AC03309 TaxID=2779376 RepID=UPI001E3AFC00|nr:nuclear transport factor 2 family protein [Microtetraspora sp. AC03309]MCC5574862.1 nuclear transport factor 2 family protein [Microtetraspora sp. AC03309]
MTVAPQTTPEIVDAFFARFAEGDLPGLLDLFADRVDFLVPGAPNVPWTGARSGKDEIAEFFTLLGKELTPAEEFTIDATVIEDGHAVVTGRSRFGVVSTGKPFTNEFALHFTVADGRITGYRMHEDSHAISVAFTK